MLLYSKQLMLNQMAWEDFSALINFTGRASVALTDVFCAPLKLILSDEATLQRLNASLPKRVHFEEKSSAVDVELLAAEQLGQTFASAETFDHEYNGFKLFAHRLSSDMVDHIRWHCILRAVLLRLEPVKQLRRAVLEVAVALDLATRHQRQQTQITKGEASEQLLSTAKYAKVLAVGTTPRKKARFEVPAGDGPAEGPSAAPVAGHFPLPDDVMERINTPRNKTGKRGFMQGFNRDAIFGITANYTTALERVSSAAVALETLEVHALSASHKLIILRALCEACFDTTRIAELLVRNADERANQITAMNKKQKEQKAKMKEVTTAKKELALDICRQLLRESNDAAATTSSSGGKKKTGASKSKKDKDCEPSAEMVAAMVDDLVMLEEFGVQTVSADVALEPVSDDEEEEDDEAGDESDDEEAFSTRRRPTAAARSKAKDRQRVRDEKRYRNQIVEQAQQRLVDALESRSEKALRSAIRNAERAKFRGKDERGRVYATVTLKNAYRALYEIESRAREEKEAFQHEKLLDEFFVRTTPVGVDRFGNHFWRFAVDDHRLFVQLQGRLPPSAESDDKRSLLLSAAPPSDGAHAEGVLSRLYASRPGQVAFRWRIYSSQTELWRIVSSLHEGIESEKDLKRKLIAAFDLVEPAVEYVTEGHEWIGRQVTRTFGRRKVVGTIIGWAPPANDDPALWRVMHTDGDEEDLEEHEVIECLVEEDEDEEDADEDDNGGDGDGDDAEVGDDGDDGSDSGRDEAGADDGEEGDEALDAPDSFSANADDEEAAEKSAKQAEPSCKAVLKPSEHDGEAEADFSAAATSVKGRLSASASASNLNAAQATEQEEPRLVKLANGLSRSNAMGRALIFPPGIAGLRLELMRLLDAIYDQLKKRGAAVDRESRRSLEASLRQSESVGELKPLLLALEELVRSVQKVDDAHDAEEQELQRAAQRLAMETEGWVFSAAQSEAIGSRARRFFKGFGPSDGEIVAMLPAALNDGTPLFRMAHTDGDEEDLDERDTLRAIEAFRQNWTELDARKALARERREERRKDQLRTGNDAMDVDEAEGDEDALEDVEELDEDGADEDDDEGDADEDETLVEDSRGDDDRNGFPSLTRRLAAEAALDEDARRLWPTQEVRLRWQAAVTDSCTVGELAMAAALLEEVAHSFGVLDEGDPNAPLIFRPHVAAVASSRKGSSGAMTGSGREQRPSAYSGHSMLSPRKAKKRALGEIARQTRDDDYDTDDDADDRNRRGARSSRFVSSETVYNSGRPSRSAAQRVTSYAE